MFIREIKEKYPLVYERIIAQTSPSLLHAGRIGQDLDVNGALNWAGTLEGGDFWEFVYLEKWDEAKELQPQLFNNHIEGITIKTNGLFE